MALCVRGRVCLGGPLSIAIEGKMTKIALEIFDFLGVKGDLGGCLGGCLGLCGGLCVAPGAGRGGPKPQKMKIFI